MATRSKCRGRSRLLEWVACAICGMTTLPVCPRVGACTEPNVLVVGAHDVNFEREIRPLLQQYCVECHGPEAQRGNLRLDAKGFAFEGGSGQTIVPGDAASSELIRRVQHPDAELRMPAERAALPADDVAKLARWIDAGAVWPETDADRAALLDPRRLHWAFQPLRPIRIPALATSAIPSTATPSSWNAIDRFVLGKLAEHDLSMSGEADRRTLLRRVSLDLLGLPPTPEQVEAFLHDTQPLAFERVVDEMLASPRYGERWGQHWLDVVRYADTHGFEVNTPRDSAWPYRDYVIDAFNSDLPYDVFVKEQICGDTMGRDAATGFLVAAAALLPGQIGADDESKRLARQDALDEVIVGTSTTLLGLTLGCARCHDHKFDPLTQRDYYAMQAFFAGMDYGDRPLRRADQTRSEQLVFAGTFREPDVTYVLRRGDPEQRSMEIGPAFPALFGTLNTNSFKTEADRRIALADWLASPSHPLTARVVINRLWLNHFGRGLVTTPSDFGVNGARPTHPELLDWLAAELIRSDWSLKHVQRLIVLSHSYRQQSLPNGESLAEDRDCQWLWRYPARRLEAEAIRDAILATTRELNLSMGGPGFNFFQSRGGLNGFPPIESFGPPELRRMVYAHKVRMETVPVFGAFDCPDAGQSMPQRGRSTTAIQALNLFNSPFMIERAERFAQRVIREVGPDRGRQVTRAFALALQREPTEGERSEAEQAIERHNLDTLCRVLFNSNEFLFLP